MNFGINKEMLKLANKDWTARWGKFQASESTAKGVVKQSSLLKKWLRGSLVNLTKSAGMCEFGHIY